MVHNLFRSGHFLYSEVVLREGERGMVSTGYFLVSGYLTLSAIRTIIYYQAFSFAWVASNFRIASMDRDLEQLYIQWYVLDTRDLCTGYVPVMYRLCTGYVPVMYQKMCLVRVRLL